MEKLQKLVYALLIGVIAIVPVSCSNDDPDEPGDKPDIVEPGTPVDDPSNTISVNLLVGESVKSATHLGNNINVYIDAAYNLCGGDYTELIDLGEVAGLGNITTIPETGWKKKTAIEVGHGYVIKSDEYWSGTHYARLYVASFMQSMEGSIMGYSVKYQCPMNTPIKLQTKSIELTANGRMDDGEVATINLLSGTNISIKSKPTWCNVELTSSTVNVWAEQNLTTKQRSGTIVLTNSEGDNEITVTQNGNTEDIFAGGAGTEEDPYLISTAKQLDNIRLAPASSFKQINNIDLSSYIDSKGNGWEPILGFSGSYDGNFKTISGLWISRPTTSEIGLFGSANNAVFKHIMLTLDERGIEGHSNVASICGHYTGAEGYITQCSVNGDIKGVFRASGIISSDTEVSVTECRMIGNVTASGDWYADASGIAYGASIRDCYVIGDIISTGTYGSIRAFGYTPKNSYIIGEHECRYNSNVSYPSKNDHCYGWGNVTDEQMKLKATYEGWNFTTIWSIKEGIDYPKLRCFEK